MILHLPLWRETAAQRSEKVRWVESLFMQDLKTSLFFAHIANFAHTTCIQKVGLLAAAYFSSMVQALSRFIWGSSADALCTVLGSAGVPLRGHTMLHELGHASTAHLLFRNVRTEIDLNLWSVRGTTHVWSQGLRNLGFELSPQARLGLFNAGGPLASLLVATGERIFAEKEDLPALRASSRLDFTAHTLYALSAYFASPSQLGHDFVGIWRRLGIPPFACASVIASVGLLLEAYFKSRSKSASDKTGIPNSFALESLLPASMPASR